jgi:DNA polymerase III epsilon subunit-like protein
MSTETDSPSPIPAPAQAAGGTAVAAMARRPKRLRKPSYGRTEVAAHLQLACWQFDAGRVLGLIPDPDARRGEWSAGLVVRLLDQVAEVLGAVGDEWPTGAGKAAERLAARTGLPADRADVEALAERGLLTEVGEYKGWPLYLPLQVDAIEVELLARLVAERLAWLAASLHRREAAEMLGWRLPELERVVQERGITAGRFGRYARADIEALAADGDLTERLLADRLIGPEQSAQRLEVRRTDFDYVVAAGWLQPRRYAEVEVGRYRTVSVPLFRVGDVDALLELPGVDWEAVRACRPGQPSPLREYARLPATRAQVVHAFCTELAARYQVEVWALYRGSADLWEIDWERTTAGEPTRDQVTAALASHPGADRHRENIRIDTEAGAAMRWARAMLEPGAAVILDTETTDLYGPVCELAVIDTSGQVLLDTLVNPGCPIELEAFHVHGISDQDVADAPRWTEVLPRLLEVTAGRQILAYNADYDMCVVVGDSRRYGLAPAHLDEPQRWGCLMRARSDWSRTRRRLALGGSHCALGDAHAALDCLRTMTEGTGRRHAQEPTGADLVPSAGPVADAR